MEFATAKEVKELSDEFDKDYNAVTGLTIQTGGYWYISFSTWLASKLISQKKRLAKLERIAYIASGTFVCESVDHMYALDKEKSELVKELKIGENK